jgi:HlyD family secretion protein
MFFEEGDEVKKGDLVALLDSKDYSADLQKSKALVSQTKAQKATADDEYSRKHPLCFDNTISKLECETVQHQKEAAKANVEAAVAQAKFSKNQLGYTRLYAPDNGIILTREQEPGATVQKSQTVYTISKNSPIWIRTYVSEKNLGNVYYGMKARVLTDSVNPQTGKNREYVGRIGFISPMAEFTPKTVQTEDLRTDLVYRVRVYIDHPDKFLRQGMPTTIKISLDEKQKKQSK